MTTELRSPGEPQLPQQIPGGIECASGIFGLYPTMGWSVYVLEVVLSGSSLRVFGLYWSNKQTKKRRLSTVDSGVL